MPFTNLYYRRTVGTAKACYVCYKPTTIVLATINTVDFLYTCENHLSDPAFATLVPNEHNSSAILAEEIAKVKAEWEEKQRKKQEKEKEQEKEKTNEKDSDSAAKTDGPEKELQKQASISPQTPGSSTSFASPPKHERYQLHRDFFTMRQTEHRRRRQAAQAKELAPRLPGAPMGGI